MIFYESEVQKVLSKGLIPLKIFQSLHNAFIALDQTKDFELFDIVKLKGKSERNYYRLRKGKYRAIFYVEKSNYYIIKIAKREEIYK